MENGARDDALEVKHKKWVKDNKEECSTVFVDNSRQYFCTYFEKMHENLIELVHFHIIYEEYWHLDVDWVRIF